MYGAISVGLMRASSSSSDNCPGLNDYLRIVITRYLISACVLVLLLSAQIIAQPIKSMPLQAKAMIDSLKSAKQNAFRPLNSRGSSRMQDQLFTVSPGLKKKQALIDQDIYQLMIQQAQKGKISSSSGNLKMSTYSIPIVVHIIHDNGPENISDATVLQGVQDLNDAFENVGFYLPSTGVDVDIEFCLAVQDEFGNFTSGINRVQSTLTNLDMDNQDIALKNLIRWDPTKYLNIWLVKEITSTSMGSGVAGYAYYPSSHGNPEDGIVNEARWFGSNTDDSKIHVHEVGHYLGLKHTFEGGCTNDDCLADGDNVCDTPPDASTAPVSCSSTINTCTTDEDDISINNPFRPIANGGLGDQDDMTINYMDYGFQTCQSAFTDGQKNRMIFMLTGARNSLLQSIACLDLCTNLISSSFIASDTLLNVGNTVTFTNQSTGGVSYEWLINGTQFSTNTDETYTFNTAGTYTITLIALNGDPACTNQYSIDIVVTCPVSSSFTTDTNKVAAGDSIAFTNTSTGATSYEWFIDGVSVGTSIDLTYGFTTIGGYMVYLVAYDGTCYDTSSFQFIQVGKCNTREADKWHFGAGCGIDFSNGAPVSILGAMLDAYEGSASVAHRTTGDLLFYTDGETVWDSTHTAMANGTGLYSDPWMSSQAALIVPWPGDTSKHFIFTAAPYWIVGPGGGIHYSVVDMTLNAGLGDVTTKNQPMLNPATEKLTGVRHCNGVDYWVLSHEWNTNNFYAWLVTSAGISDTVISSVGRVHSGDDWTAMGTLKASPNGKKLAIAVMDFDTLYSTELFDFNPSTGVVSNAVELPSYPCPFGLSFSPNSSLLYVAGFEWCVSEKLIQFDISSGDSLIIAQSETDLYTWSGALGSLQIGPDGRIYLAHDITTYLGVINNPNAVGTACNFVLNGFYLGGEYSTHGLPNFIDSYFDTDAPEIIGPVLVCPLDTSTVYSLEGVNCSSGTVEWEVIGGANITSFTDSSATLNFSDSGLANLIVKMTTSCAVSFDTILIMVNSPPSVDLGADTAICTGDSVIFNAGFGFTNYEWQDGSTNIVLTASMLGEYWVKVTDSVGCVARDTVFLTVADSAITVNLGNDTVVCDGHIVTLDAGGGFDQYVWQDNSTNQSFTTWFPGTYWVTITNSCGTTATDTIEIVAASNAAVDLGNDTSICPGASFTLSAGSGFTSYEWQDASSNQDLLAATSGEFWVVATDSVGCYATDTVVITVFNSVEVNLGNDTTACAGVNIIFDAGPGYVSYLWQDASSAQTFTSTLAGAYWVQVTDSMGCTSTDSVLLSIIDTSVAVDLGNDTVICSGDVIVLNAGDNSNTFVWLGGSTDSVYFVGAPGIYWVLATNSCGNSASDTIIVIGVGSSIVDLGTDIILCEEANTTFDAGGGFSSYLWQDGSSGQTFTGSSQGSYWVIAMDSNGCNHSDTVNITISSDVCSYSLFIPDIFSPNGDGENDRFFIQGKGIESLSLVIYNRWGNKVFENNRFSANDPQAGWDGKYKGKALNSAVFVYLLTGSHTDDTPIKEHGDFTLVR